MIRDCPEAVFASYLIRLRVRDTISVDYLYRYFQSPSYWEQIADEKKGTGPVSYTHLNGDLDRLPMLTWIMFLKFLDDLELQREGEARLATKKFKAAIEPPYRWRDWAAQADGITGDELLAFINKMCIRDRRCPTC